MVEMEVSKEEEDTGRLTRQGSCMISSRMSPAMSLYTMILRGKYEQSNYICAIQGPNI